MYSLRAFTASKLIESGSAESIDPSPEPYVSFTPLHDVPAGYPNLDFRPVLLRWWFLTITCIFCLIVTTGTLIIDRKAESVGRTFSTSNNYKRLALEYGSLLVAAFTELLWGSIFGTVARMMPFFSMAHAASGNKTLGTIYFPTNDLVNSLPNRHFTYFCMGLSRIIAVSALAPLTSTFIIVSQDDQCVWNFYVSHPAAITLVVLYFILAAMAASLVFRLHGRSTGLKWDPNSIADQLALFHGSNVIEDFDKGEPVRKFRTLQSRNRTYRIGYWSVSSHDTALLCHNSDNTEVPYIWYGVGRETPSNFSSSNVSLLLT